MEIALKLNLMTKQGEKDQFDFEYLNTLQKIFNTETITEEVSVEINNFKTELTNKNKKDAPK